MTAYLGTVYTSWNKFYSASSRITFLPAGPHARMLANLLAAETAAASTGNPAASRER